MLKQDYSNYEVLLLDNGSTDESIQLAKRLFGTDPRLVIVPLAKNYGFSKGNNIGFKKTNAEYVIVLNTDTVVEPNFVTELVKVADADEKIGSVTCKILRCDGSIWYGQYFTNGGFIVPFFTQSFLEERLIKIYESPTLNLANSGCASLYRKRVLDAIGGFDEDFWADWEDYDLGYRINIAGFKSVYTPIALVTHVCGGSFGFTPKRMTRVYKNMLFTYFGNYEAKNLITRFPLFFFILLPAFHLGWLINSSVTLKRDFSRKSGADSFFTIFTGYAQFLARLKSGCKKRQSITRIRCIPDQTIFKNTRKRNLF